MNTLGHAGHSWLKTTMSKIFLGVYIYICIYQRITRGICEANQSLYWLNPHHTTCFSGSHFWPDRSLFWLLKITMFAGENPTFSDKTSSCSCGTGWIPASMESKALISLFFMAFSNWYSSPRPGYGRCCTHLESEFSLQHIRNVDEMTNFSRDRRPGFDRNRGFHRPQNLSMGRLTRDVDTHGCEGVSKWEIPHSGHVDRGKSGRSQRVHQRWCAIRRFIMLGQKKVW